MREKSANHRHDEPSFFKLDPCFETAGRLFVLMMATSFGVRFQGETPPRQKQMAEETVLWLHSNHAKASNLYWLRRQTNMLVHLRRA